MSFKPTSATTKIFSLKKRIRVISGGTAASKTISILIWCIDYAQTTKNELISVVSESFPHLNGGAIRDFKAIMKEHHYFDDAEWNETKHVYTFSTGTQIEFISVDTYGKAHGPRRDVLFMNECNNIPWLIADQLITRTRKIVWCDFNPVEEFWAHTEIIQKRDPADVDQLTLTYLDNEALDPTTIREIESHKNDKNWWTVYGLGKVGTLESRIYREWQIIDDIPHEARLERYGLDFGYTNDPTAIVALYYLNGGYIADEITYQTGLINKMIADVLNLQKKQLVIADSAEPKSIEEIRQFGVNIQPTEKGKDSINNGIQIVQGEQISVTKRSVNLIKEYRSYLWITDKDGKVLNEPQKGKDHCLDALRYALTSLVPIRRRQERIHDLMYNVKRYPKPKFNKAR